MATREVLVAPARIVPWARNFAERHGDTSFAVLDGLLTGAAQDGSRFAARLPFGREYAGPPDASAFADACAPPDEWGVLLVRKGGFAVARLHGAETVESKVGRRHVQGRSKAGGWSQQRFARRRDHQARAAYEAAAEHAGRILAGVPVLVTGGDHGAVQAVFAEAALGRTPGHTPGRTPGHTVSDPVVVPPFLPVPDPRRDVLEQAVHDAASARIEVQDVLRP